MEKIKRQLVSLLTLCLLAFQIQAHAQGKDFLTLQTQAVSISENKGVTTATVSRSGSITLPLSVSLSVDQPSWVTIPENITIEMGQDTSPSFQITANDDALLTGTRAVQITASADSHEPASTNIQLEDHENLFLTIDSQTILEGNNATLTVKRGNSNQDQPLKVFLQVEDNKELSAPPDVQIPEKADSVSVSITAINDLIADGSQTSRIFASADGYVAAEISITSQDQSYDYGDAPEVYPVRSGNNGAKHLTSGPVLGTNRDPEKDGQPNANALGDDAADFDDEDGVSIPTLATGQESTIDVTVSQVAGRLDAWIDWNQNGVWETPVEKIADNLSLPQGTHQIKVQTPLKAAIGNTFARFRISSSGNLSPGGSASDGEVEDHSVKIISGATAPTVELTKRGNLPASLGQSVVLESSYTGTEPLLFQWTKNDQDIQGANTRTLNLDNLEASDAGAYQLKVTNQAGTATSSVLNLGILGLISVNGQTSSNILPAGDNAAFLATLYGSGSFQFEWVKDGVILGPRSTNILILESITSELSGEYYSIVHGTVTDLDNQAMDVSVLSLPSSLFVQTPPQVTLEAIGKAAMPFDTISNGSLRGFLLQGDEPITYQWYKDGLAIPNGNQLILSMPNVRSHFQSMAGSYTLQASNRAGSHVTEPFQMGILGHYLIDGVPAESFDTIEGQPASIALDLDMQPPFNIQWYYIQTGDFFSAQPIPDSNSPILTIDSPDKLQHEGYYFATVETDVMQWQDGQYSPLSIEIGIDSPFEQYVLNSGIFFHLTVSELPLDFGDAPEKFPITQHVTSYPTLLESNGARHIIEGPMLGATRDSEVNGKPSNHATGDDTDGVDGVNDEDGITIPILIPGEEADISIVVTAANGKLDSWFDWNADGDWEDAGERMTDSLNLSIGTHIIRVNVPEAISSELTFARFRISTEGGLQPGGAATDGEVEDYQVYFSTSGNRPPQANEDQFNAVTNKPLKISIPFLLSNDQDPDNNHLSLDSFAQNSQRGGTIKIDGATLTYISAPGLIGPDSFDYTITDTGDLRSTGRVIIRVSGTEETELQKGRVKLMKEGSGEDVDFVFAGLPGQTYAIQVSEDLREWRTVTTIKSGPNGVVRFLDENALFLSKRFYRVIIVP